MINRMKSGVQGFLRRFGYQLIHAAPLSATGASAHEEVRPWATYAPWNGDPEFIAAYNTIQDYTLVDLYRCWELWTLVGQSAKLDRGGILEIGVWRGGTGALMAKKAALCGSARSAAADVMMVSSRAFVASRCRRPDFPSGCRGCRPR